MGYPIKNLGDICDLYQPKTISTKEMIDDGNYPVFGANGIIGKYNKYNHEEKELLITCRGATCGSINISEKFSWINGNAMVSHIKDNNIVYFNFLYYVFKNLDFSKVISGSAQPQITRGGLVDIAIPLPPLPTQKLIVQKLDSSFEKIDKSIELTKKNLENIEELNKSVLEEVFSEGEYKMKTIDKVFKIKSGKFLPKSKMIESGEIDVYGGNGINGKHNEYNLNGENIIIGRVGALCGNVRYIEGKIWLTDNAFYISDYLVDVDKKYLNKFLSFRKLGNTSNASAQPVISYKSIQEIKIPLPPLQKQKEIVAQLDKVFEKNKALKESYEKKLKDLEEMKQSLLKEAFEARLVKE